MKQPEFTYQKWGFKNKDKWTSQLNIWFTSWVVNDLKKGSYLKCPFDNGSIVILNDLSFISKRRTEMSVKSFSKALIIVNLDPDSPEVKYFKMIEKLASL